jgi:polysaccharide biosynthesis/export protein
VRELLFFVMIGVAMAQVAPSPVEYGLANLPAQRIGPNDLIAISIYDAPEFTRTIRVGSDGTIRMPMVKRKIQAERLLPNELESAIAEALKLEELVVDPFVTVTVVEYHSRPITVAGAVHKPITFQAVGTVTLLDALTRAEGLASDAGPEILVTRAKAEEEASQSGLVQRIPVKGLLDGSDAKLNIGLTGGEEIRVPEVGKIFVLGNVKKPGVFRVADDGDTTVLNTLAQAEGLSPYATKLAYIYRREGGQGGKKQEIPVELRKIMDRKAPDVALQANDILYVPDNTGRRMALTALERALAFGGATASGILVYSH